MTVNNGPFASWTVRYRYLLKNLAHPEWTAGFTIQLSKGKLDAYEAERRYQAQREDYQAAWRQPYDNRSDYYQERDYEPPIQPLRKGCNLSRGSRSK